MTCLSGVALFTFADMELARNGVSPSATLYLPCIIRQDTQALHRGAEYGKS